MITLDGMKFMLVCMPIILSAISICAFLFVRFGNKKPILTLLICGVIVVVMLYAIYFLRVYGADVGWFPPIGPDEMTNLSVYTIANYI